MTEPKKVEPMDTKMLAFEIAECDSHQYGHENCSPHEHIDAALFAERKRVLNLPEVKALVADGKLVLKAYLRLPIGPDVEAIVMPEMEELEEALSNFQKLVDETKGEE